LSQVKSHMADSNNEDSKLRNAEGGDSQALPAIPVPERPPILDYARAGDGRSLCARSATIALTISLVCHFLLFTLYATTLDGGVLARKCAEVSAGYWVVAALVLARRRWNPTKLDLAFLAAGYPVMLVVCGLFGAL
jgi:hypothetical protein